MNDSDLRAKLSLSLGGAYIIDRELQATSASRLFVARELLLDRDVLVKVLSEEISRGISAERFAREVHLISTLQEPHTVPMLTAGAMPDGRVYYTMPFIGEPSLGHRLEQAPVSFDDSITALRDLARAMEHAHRQGIVHGDIKPENVFLIRGTAVVTDFGLASALEASRDGEGERGRLRLVDSPVVAHAYTAPEHVAAGRDVDHRADIYAWGVMAYELLYDVHPFPNVNTVGELLDAHVHAVPPVPAHKSFGVPEQLATLVMRCLAKNPDERPSDAAELVTLLERIPSGAAALAVESWSPYRLIGMALLAFAAFLGLATAVWRLQSVGSSAIPLVAVLPFENSGSAPDSLYADAVANGVTSKLQRLAGIRVVDIASVHALPGGPSDPAEVGRSLGAQFVLRTSMRWFRDVDGSVRAQLSPTLIQVSDGTIKWAGEPMLAFPADPFTPTSTLATQAARELGIEMGEAQKEVLAERGTNDTTAYAAFMRGHALYRRTLQWVAEPPVQAREHLERAFTLDPKYADALGAWASLRAGEARHHATPALLDSIVRAARRALVISPANVRALVANARVTLVRHRLDESLWFVGRALEQNASDVDALQLRTELLLLVGDSASVWRDVESIVRIAPRSPNALADAAATAMALRRFNDAREFLDRARSLVPARTDLILRAAQLARHRGNRSEMVRLVNDARVMGARLGVGDLSLLRSGDSVMQRELATSTPSMYGVTSAADSAHYYIEKAKLFMLRRDKVSARILDTAAVALKAVLEHESPSGATLRQYAERGRWIVAAGGDRERVLSTGIRVPTAPVEVQFPDGAYDAFLACNNAEIHALSADVDVAVMLPVLERCLTLPGGYSVHAIRSEPALARHVRDPRVAPLLARLGLDAPAP